MILQDLIDKIEAAQGHVEQVDALMVSYQSLDDLARLQIEDPIALEVARSKIEAHRGMKDYVSRWVRKIADRAREMSAARPTPAAAPAPLDRIARPLGIEGLESPPGYRIGPDGVWRDDLLVTATPAVITCQYADIESREVSVELSWLDMGRWDRVVLPRSTVTDSRKIGALADYGIDVSSGSATDLVAYLRSFALHNRGQIPRSRLSRRCGWIGKTFLRGRHSHGDPIVLEADGGLARIADGIDVSGSVAEWCAMVEEHAAPRPSLLLAIYTSLCAPLLHVVGADGFVADWSGPSGRGKSTALDLACSVWGNPDTYRQGWDAASSVGPQEIAAFLHHLPLVMDDTNKAGRTRQPMIEGMLYAIPGGLERMRGQKAGGIRTLKSWRTVLISSGEQPITTYAGGNAGAKRRAICISGAPMGSVSEENSNKAKIIQDGSRRLYGAAGEAFTSCLCSTPREALRERYGALLAKYNALGVGSTDRSLGAAVSAIELASEISRAFLRVEERERIAAVGLAWSAAVESGADSDEPVAALRDLWAWVASNPDRMYRGGVQSAPSLGFVGTMALDSAGRWTEFALQPTLTAKLLDDWGRKSEYCVSEWARRGLLMVGSKGRTRSRNMGPHDGRVRLLCFSRAVLEAEGVLVDED